MSKTDPAFADPQAEAVSAPEASTARARHDRERFAAPVWATAIKVIVLAICNAVGVLGAFVAVLADSWIIAGVIVAMLIAIDIVYLRRRAVASKYLLPGILFLLVYQVFVIGYTAYIGFTNYGDGHNSTKEDAIEAILSQSEIRVADSAAYPLTVVRGLEGLGFAVVDDGDILVGTADRPISSATGEVSAGRAVAVDGWEVIPTGQLSSMQAEVFALRVPVSDDVNDGTLRTTDGLNAYVYRSDMTYDEATDTMTDGATGVVYTATDDGVFVSDDGAELTPGWRVWVGVDNFARVFGDERIRGSFLSVLVWTVAFAAISTASTFVLGLGLALLLNKQRMRSRFVYRSLLILPNAFPVFLAAFVWSGMLNTDFGFINQTLFGGAQIEWLTDPWLAKLSTLVLNLWLGFPYMFLVCTGALQSIPDELTEAARVDGASAWRTLVSVRLPLLLVSVAPVLITTFTFNFNNFNVIYLLTGGGPPDLSAPVPVGSTDILISFVYKLAFGGAGRDYGLACAISILIFLIVAVVAIVSFRRTRNLEEVLR